MEISQVLYDVQLYLARSLFTAASIGGRLLQDVGIVGIRGQRGRGFFRWTNMKINERFSLYIIVLISFKLEYKYGYYPILIKTSTIITS